MQIKITSFKDKNVLILDLPQSVVAGTVFVTKKQSDTFNFFTAFFRQQSIKWLLIADRTVAVCYEETANAAELQAVLLAEVDDFCQAPQNLNSYVQTENSALLIETVADVFIRPTLYADKGNIEIISYENNILTLRFVGHCAGCPYAQNTLNNVIAQAFNRYLPQRAEIKLAENQQ